MTSTTEALAQKTGFLHGVLPGKTHQQCVSSLTCSALVFLGGMALTGVSFFAERAIINTLRKL